MRSHSSDRCSWVWSCSTGPERWGLSDIQWHSIPPEHSLGCIQSGSQPRQQSCSPCGGRFGARGPSCTGWRWSVEQLQKKVKKKKNKKKTKRVISISPLWFLSKYYVDFLDRFSLVGNIFSLRSTELHYINKQFASSQHSLYEWLCSFKFLILCFFQSDNNKTHKIYPINCLSCSFRKQMGFLVLHLNMDHCKSSE